MRQRKKYDEQNIKLTPHQPITVAVTSNPSNGLLDQVNTNIGEEPRSA
ncbi:MAG TPA: hypothetical protein V6C65_35215 [Allocoleopsis sp.]